MQPLVALVAVYAVKGWARIRVTTFVESMHRNIDRKYLHSLVYITKFL